MSDDLLALGAVIFELGLPIIIGIACYMRPKVRKFLLPVLGAVTPLLIAYIYTVIGYYLVSREEYQYGFLVMWVMSFFAYCILVAIGIILGIFLKNKLNNYWRFFIGLASAPLIASIFLSADYGLA